jgi:hypothetical protein
MLSLPIEERIHHYFIAMGALCDENPSNPRILSFMLGKERTLVSVLSITDIIQRNRIIDTLLHLSSLRNEGTQPYIAAPRLLGATLDSQILRSSGIGLLLYDDRRIEETIKPEPIQRMIEPQAPSSSTDTGLISELATLRSMYAELEKNMSMMMTEFKSLQESVMSSRSCNSDPMPAFGALQRPEATIQRGVPDGGTLPSFFTNNPWLDVLSRRGRTGESPLAG